MKLIPKKNIAISYTFDLRDISLGSLEICP
jgi:hypothetical protein